MYRLSISSILLGTCERITWLGKDTIEENERVRQ